MVETYFHYSGLRVPWLDREALVKRIERLLKEVTILQNKMEDMTKKEVEDNKDSDHPNVYPPNYQVYT